jgi:hypothetical protein
VTNQTQTLNPIRARDPNAHRLTATGRRVVCPGQYLPAALADLDMSHFINVNVPSTTDEKCSSHSRVYAPIPGNEKKLSSPGHIDTMLAASASVLFQADENSVHAIKLTMHSNRVGRKVP